MAGSLGFRTGLACLIAAMGLSLCGVAYSQTNPPEQGAGSNAAGAANQTPPAGPEEVPAATTTAVARTQPGALPLGPGPMGAEPLPPGANYHAVNLNAEGAITGRVTQIDPRTGVRVPTMDVMVNFVQFGRIVAQARPGQNGEFSIRLRPGVYSVIVSGPGGFGAFSVIVQPFDPMAPIEATQLLLDGTLVPPGDLEIVAGLANRNLGIFAPPFGPGGGAGAFGGGGGVFGGGGGGGTGGLGNLLGLAGLAAGVAALADDDDEAAAIVGPSSPAAP
jgi:hypothetical protein